MRSALAGSILLLCAACGRADPDVDRPVANDLAPAPIVPANEAVAATPADPRRTEVIDAVARALGDLDPSARAAVRYADIGGDERDEALVYVADLGRCGSGGCALVILTPSGRGWRSVGQTSVTQLPVHRLRTSREGWNDLAVGVGGGGREAGTALLRFTGGQYPSNPTVQPILNRLPEGARELIPDSPDALTPAR